MNLDALHTPIKDHGKLAPVILVQNRIYHRIAGAVGKHQPLTKRHEVVVRTSNGLAEFRVQDDNVVWQPAQAEQQHHYKQHADGFRLNLVMR